MSSSQIPLVSSPVNVMEAGPNGNNLASQATQPHFVESLQHFQSKSNGFRGFLDLDGIRRLYGSGLAMTLQTERKLAMSNGGRLPGMEGQSNLLLDTVTGKDTTLDLEDILNRPEESPVARMSSPHAAMESKLGLM